MCLGASFTLTHVIHRSHEYCTGVRQPNDWQTWNGIFFPPRRGEQCTALLRQSGFCECTDAVPRFCHSLCFHSKGHFPLKTNLFIAVNKLHSIILLERRIQTFESKKIWFLYHVHVWLPVSKMEIINFILGTTKVECRALYLLSWFKIITFIN